jgi:hypothetical protein
MSPVEFTGEALRRRSRYLLPPVLEEQQDPLEEGLCFGSPAMMVLGSPLSASSLELLVSFNAIVEVE